jgi:hypothetical protein
LIFLVIVSAMNGFGTKASNVINTAANAVSGTM